MAASTFLVKQDPTAAGSRVNGVNGMVIVAETAADAKAIAQSKFGNDSNFLWANATATAAAATADMAGYTLNIKIISPAGATVVNVTVTGAASATLDSIGALAVTALNATAPIAGAAYASNSLKVAETTDNLGDHRLVVTFAPPVATYEVPKHIPGLIGSLTHQGIVAAVLTVPFAADGYTVPNIVGLLTQR